MVVQLAYYSNNIIGQTNESVMTFSHSLGPNKVENILLMPQNEEKFIFDMKASVYQ